ncbi:3-oxoacyl-ACP reductase FabG [Carboxylicivirga sp. N1Y90]|uniref:3-oxoacyl-ACP reductase FabG n=1 Tax=Carboxylicivirga fragile TaxID=3417571 RepID=UPI003D358BF0|nr:3-oxoacyl-ACP reductase FabG [Marinilabiliaceae bacterium N1Y90]
MKNALVTGGSRGIGKAISLALAQQGCYVLINYRSNHAEAEKVLDEIKENGGSAELLPFDVSSSSQVNEILGGWMQKNEKYIDILVNNAGITADNLMVFMSDDEWNKVINTNQNSFFYVTREVLEGMVVSKFGRIINVVSLSGQKGHPGQVNYSASKGAIMAATKSLSMEVGKKKITVNCVAPGFIKTDMTEQIDEKSWKKMIPLNRFGEAKEVASVVSFLASDGASYITGETIAVNGGMYS